MAASPAAAASVVVVSVVVIPVPLVIVFARAGPLAVAAVRPLIPALRVVGVMGVVLGGGVRVLLVVVRRPSGTDPRRPVPPRRVSFPLPVRHWGRVKLVGHGRRRHGGVVGHVWTWSSDTAEGRVARRLVGAERCGMGVNGATTVIH